MTAEQKRRFHELQVQDFVEMQLIYEAVAAGIAADAACSSIVGGKFSLTPLVRQGVGENEDVTGRTRSR
jgi:hypothetical protein